MNRFTLPLAMLGLVLSCAPTLAQDTEDEVYAPDESVPFEKCISLSRLNKTEVLNERNILFHMRGNKVFRNVLVRRCPGMRKDQAFSYRATLNRLCDRDRVTLISPIGLGDVPGPSCTLGKFYPISEAEAEALRLEAERVEELSAEIPE